MARLVRERVAAVIEGWLAVLEGLRAILSRSPQPKPCHRCFLYRYSTAQQNEARRIVVAVCFAYTRLLSPCCASSGKIPGDVDPPDTEAGELGSWAVEALLLRDFWKKSGCAYLGPLLLLFFYYSCVLRSCLFGVAVPSWLLEQRRKLELPRPKVSEAEALNSE